MAKLKHICEVCSKEEILESQEAFDAGWDYPPAMGQFGVVSPRTCGNCSIDKTIWYALIVEKKKPEDLTAEQEAVIRRILQEPASILVKEV